MKYRRVVDPVLCERCQLTQERRYELADGHVRAFVQVRQPDSTRRLTRSYMLELFAVPSIAAAKTSMTIFGLVTIGVWSTSSIRVRAAMRAAIKR